MESPKFERVTKLDAVRRQLKTAIRLFLQDGDAVSVYMLTAAAQDVLRNLLEKKGVGGSAIKNFDSIRPEHRDEYQKLAWGPQNFFKHADRDADAILDFRPAVVVPFLLDCVRMYYMLTGRMLREGIAFTVWQCTEDSHFLDLLVPGAFADRAQALATQRTWRWGKAALLQTLDDPTVWSDAD